MKQPPLTAIIQKRRLLLFGHLARMDKTADARRILTGVHQRDWSRPVGCPYTSWMATLKSDLSLHKLKLTFEDAIELALDKSQNPTTKPKQIYVKLPLSTSDNSSRLF